MLLERLDPGLDAILLANRFTKLLSCLEGLGLDEELESRGEVLYGELFMRDAVEECEVSERARGGWSEARRAGCWTDGSGPAPALKTISPQNG
jgi:hypothetical protein